MLIDIISIEISQCNILFARKYNYYYYYTIEIKIRVSFLNLISYIYIDITGQVCINTLIIAIEIQGVLSKSVSPRVTCYMSRPVMYERNY